MFVVFVYIVECVSQYYVLVQQLFCWFIGVYYVCVVYQFMEEVEVEQVYDGVFDIVDVDIYWQLVVGCF